MSIPTENPVEDITNPRVVYVINFSHVSACNSVTLVIIFVLIIVLWLCAAPLLAPRESSAAIDGEYIVVFKKETSVDEGESTLAVYS